MGKTFRRIAFIFGIVCLAMLLASVLLTYVYRQDIAVRITQKIKENFKGKFQYAHARLNYITKPGELTLSFEKVLFLAEDSAKVSEKALAELTSLHFSLGLMALFQGEYQVKKVYVEGAKIHLERNSKKQSNYAQIWKKTPQSKADKLQWPMDEYQLDDVEISYTSPKEYHTFHIKNLNGKALSLLSRPVFGWKGRLQSLKLSSQNQVFWEEREVSFAGKTSYEASKKSIQLSQGSFRLKETDFVLEGNYGISPQQTPEVDFRFSGFQKDLGQIFALLPEQYYREWQGFTSYGQVDFRGEWKGEWTQEKYPHLGIHFSGKNIAIHSKHNVRRSIEKLNFEGKFSSGDANGLETSSLRLENIQGSIGSRRFQADFYLSNLRKPYLAFNAEAGIDLAYWNEFYPMQHLQNIKGLLGFKLNFDGEWAELKADKEPSEKKITLTGQLELANTSFKIRHNPMAYEDLQLRLDLVNNQANIQQAEGKIGKSDFEINGKIFNLMPYLLEPAQILLLDGRLYAQRIDAEDLLKNALTGISAPNPTQPNPTGYIFNAPEHIELYLQCSIDSLLFRKFKGTKLKGDIELKEKVFRTGNLHLDLAGGAVHLLGICNAQKENFIRLDGRVILTDTQAEQVFYAFEDFSQDFIKEQNLQGTLNADIKGGLVFDRNMLILFEHLVADIDSRLSTGELKDLVLMKDIARKIQADEIAQVKFKEMKNIIQVRNQTIFIPETEIKTDKNILSIIGRATLDKGLDYKIKVPLKQTFINPQASATLQNGNEAVYYLSVKGKAQNFRVSFMDTSDKSQLEAQWINEKKSYLNLFKKNSLSEDKFQIDTVRISYFN